MLYPNKLTSQHLSSKCGRLNWENATQQEHKASMGKEDTNDNAESPFESLTLQLDIFSGIGINHSSALVIMRHNNNLYQNEVEPCKRRKKKK